MSKYDLNKAGIEDLQARIDEVIDCTIDEKKLAGAIAKSKIGGYSQ
ncbi:hypothetical protein [Paenibacillus macquariensis]|uniref:Uncharacterized protein n=1 Tax=Paenibacillus macquariensis TaxID=948756 RepID=A0ABY1K5H4_9BACL|nr:hypothetical protein [Paenibacillus macquariensis]MEC0090445.1 hypothetical protein [Paenibacillus macquariensis]SIR29153.1 hypothetical protein SAMN05421578_11061 [Paenibacillus macquariensis]